jgi:hypothetical protein
MTFMICSPVTPCLAVSITITSVVFVGGGPDGRWGDGPPEAGWGDGN